MKSIITIVITLFFTLLLNAQNTDTKSLYSASMKEYELGRYENAAEKFKIIINNSKFDSLSTTELYNGACIFSLAKKNEIAINMLDYLVSERFYSNYKHITSDTDLNNIHSEQKWKGLIEKVAENKKTKPVRLRKKIEAEFFKAKDILLTENGKLWGENIWSDNILVLDFDNTIYAIKPLPDSKTNDSLIYYKKIPPNTLGFSNSAQKFNEEEYAIVLANYLDDNSSTIIHELFHILQHKHISLNGEAIAYLDNYDAREWLRLEYQALKNALNAIDQNKEKSEVEQYVNDAFLFRKVRQSKYIEYLQKEVEIETSEGLANYTGFVLSTHTNKYQKAISEINQRENAKTYTRPFPYASGPAYGLIFDYLKINWRVGLDTTYNFSEIYETLYLGKSIKPNKLNIRFAIKRSNYLEIHREEIERKTKQEELISYYTKVLVTNPTLRVTSIGNSYNRTFDMNGTLALGSKSIVYSSIKGTAKSADDFGNFKIIEGKGKLGVSGIMGIWDDKKMTFVFPLPIRIDGNLIIGKFYEIELNEGWEVKKINEKGDMEIIKTK